MFRLLCQHRSEHARDNVPKFKRSLFATASQLFVDEEKSIWTAMLVCSLSYHCGRAKTAIGCIESAQSALFHSGVANNTALTDLLRALLLQQNIGVTQDLSESNTQRLCG